MSAIQLQAIHRRFPRYDITGVAASFVVPTKVEVVNLSLGGMALETREYLESGRDYVLRVNDGRQSISLTGTVVWCSLRRTVKAERHDVLPVYRAGFKFQVISGRRLRELWHFIRRNSTVPLQDSAEARYPIDLTSVPWLTSNYRCKVMRLSLSGMLVESTFSPELNDRYGMELLLKRHTCETTGRIASLPRPGRSGDMDQIGVEFGILTHREQKILGKYLSRWGRSLAS